MSQNYQNPQNHIDTTGGAQPLAAAIKTLLFLCVALCLSTSCKKEVDMTLVQKTVHEDHTLEQIRVNDGWDVTIVYDSLSSFVELEYSAYLEEYVSVTEIDNGVSIAFNSKFYKQPYSVYKATIHIKERDYLSINAENKSIVTLEGRFELENSFEMNLHSASVCSGFEVSTPLCSILVTEDSQLLGAYYEGANCSVLVTKNSCCKGDFAVGESFNADVMIQSQLILFGGSMPSARIEAKEASTINMAQSEVEEMYVLLDGASEATVNVTNNITGFLLSASTLYYRGNPVIDIDCSDDSQLIRY